MKNNGVMFLKIWRGALASIMVAAVVAAWHAKGELAAIGQAVAGLQKTVDKIDDRLRSIEMVRWRDMR